MYVLVVFIENAIREVFPETRHRWCIWHVMRNATKNLSTIDETWNEMSKGLHRVLYHSLTITEFEENWPQWVAEFGLQNTTWCTNMYANRSKWVPVYFRSDFWAGMSSTQRSEGINFFFKGLICIAPLEKTPIAAITSGCLILPKRFKSMDL